MPFPSPGHLPKPEMKPTSPALASRFFTTEPPGKLILYLHTHSSAVFRRKHDPGLDMPLERNKNSSDTGGQRIFPSSTSFNHLFNKNVLKTYEKPRSILDVVKKKKLFMTFVKDERDFI